LGIGHAAQFGSKQLAGDRRWQTVPSPQVVDVNAVHPFAATAQLRTTVEDMQSDTPPVHAFVQHDAAPGAPPHAPSLHFIVIIWNKQVCGSCAQTATVDVSAQEFPSDLQTGSVLQLQPATPAVTAQVCRGPQALTALH
jgi:hypothetical protein